MFHSQTGLPHLLPPEAYRSSAWEIAERQGPLSNAWYLVGTTGSLANVGSFLTTEVFGQPIQVRRFEQGLVAVSNVCAHRHCLISSLRAGRSDTMRCQYHGWEYGSDGYTRKIPCAKDLAPIDREELRLPTYPVETCGQLVFVRLSSTGLSLNDYLGTLAPKMNQSFGEGTQCFLQWSCTYDANWKVAIENSLEAYHVEAVHPNTFRSSPGESRSEHVLEERHTAFGTDLPFSHSKMDAMFQRYQGWVVKRLGRVPTNRYWQHHVFPNLLTSYTDMISLVHSVVPIAPNRSRSDFFQFGPAPRPFLKRLIANGWGKLEVACTRRILKEDIEMYPKIQSGLNASQHRGRLARSEERIHRFQQFMLDATQIPGTATPSPTIPSTTDIKK